MEGRYRDECRAMLVKDLAIQNRDPSICGMIPAGQLRVRQLCDIHFQPPRPVTDEEEDAAISQILGRNVLLVEGRDGAYSDEAEARGVEVGGWSWDVKIADFDNDGWQDIYIVNGTWVPNEVTPSNIFLSNDGTGRFSEETERFGLTDFLMTAAAITADLDNDGDLDLVTVPVNAPTIAYINNSQDGHAIAFRLEDEIGNHYGVGARIEIETASGRQVREIQSGGGFMSFDAPVAHFGLGEDEVVDEVVVHWPDGGSTVIDEALDAGATYTIARSGSRA
jgi:hypothetical protein